MHTPLVSVILAVKNGERFLGQAIESVLAQDYRPIELIVVDGQSVDDTARIAKSFSQVHYLCEDGAPGLYRALNLGMSASSGEFIGFISHDDLWAANKLTVQVDYLLRHPEIQYAITRLRFFQEPGYSIPPGFRRALLVGDHIGRVPETMLARRSLFDALGKFDPSFISVGDVDWSVRAADSGARMATIQQVLVHKRVHDANLSLNAPSATPDLLKALRQSIRRKSVARQGVLKENDADVDK
jgi:glycosyltransferase involved in cell wall biosynthesis